MPVTETAIPAEKLPAFYEEFCSGMSAVVDRLQLMHAGQVQQANVMPDERERQCFIASASAIDTCITMIAQAFAQAANAVGESATAIELAQRYT